MAKRKKNPLKLEAEFISHPRYRQVAKAMSKATRAGVKRWGKAVVRHAKTSSRTPRDTGALADSIEVSTRKIANEKQYAVSIRTGAGKGGQHYGGKVHAGNPMAGTPPKPFLVWALEEAIPEMEAIFKEEARNHEGEVPRGPKGPSGPRGRDGNGRFI